MAGKRGSAAARRLLVTTPRMLWWALTNRRFEPGDARLPVGRALAFAWSAADPFGDWGLKRLDCGCSRRFGREHRLCHSHLMASLGVDV